MTCSQIEHDTVLHTGQCHHNSCVIKEQGQTILMALPRSSKVVYNCIADYVAHAQAKKLFLWLSRNEHSPLVARHIKFLSFAWACAM